mgnify:CR=1 FL=1
MCRILAAEVHRRLILDCNGRDLRPGGHNPRPGGHNPRSRVAPPGSGRFSRRDAAVRTVLCWRRLRRSPSRRRPPGSGRFPAAYPLSGAAPPKFWVVSQENGPEFDALLEFWAVFSALRCDSRRKLRHNPRSGVSALSAPRSAAYETAQNFARALAKVANSSPQSTAYETAQNFAQAFLQLGFVRLGMPTEPPRTSFGRYG